MLEGAEMPPPRRHVKNHATLLHLIRVFVFGNRAVAANTAA
jgi:hypothetical protein